MIDGLEWESFESRRNKFRVQMVYKMFNDIVTPGPARDPFIMTTVLDNCNVQFTFKYHKRNINRNCFAIP